jgi:hypothetical protein
MKQYSRRRVDDIGERDQERSEMEGKNEEIKPNKEGARYADRTGWCGTFCAYSLQIARALLSSRNLPLRSKCSSSLRFTRVPESGTW